MVTPIEKVYSIRLAVQGENATTPIEIDMTSWAKEFPDMYPEIIFRPYNQQHVAPCVTEYDPETHILQWIPTASITQFVGVGSAEVRWLNADLSVIKKSRMIPTSIENSVSGEEGIEPPAAYADWVASVMVVKDIAIEAEAGRVAAEAGRVAAEEGRVEAEEDRVEAEEDRVSAEEARAAAESGRVTAEGLRTEAEELRVAAESARVTAEQGRVTAEQGRVTAEISRSSAERLRNQEENTRRSNEQSRNENEYSRMDAETTRNANEATRRSNEADRVSAESDRVSAEQNRVENEVIRVTNEGSRNSSEFARANAEVGRSNAESVRASHELDREAAEEARAEEYAAIKENAEAMLGYIAPAETTSTASAGHAVDTYLIYDGNLYRVTAAISTGDTLTPGTNLTLVSSLSYVVYLLKRFAEITLAGRIDNLESVLARPYTVGSNYQAGEYVFHNHYLYKCKYGIQNAGEFNASQWTEITSTANMLNYLMYKIENTNDYLTLYYENVRNWVAYDQGYAAIGSGAANRDYAIGEYLVLWGTLYEVTAAINEGESIQAGVNVKTVPGGLGSKITALMQAMAMIAPEFSESTTYYAGDFIRHDGKLYRFTARQHTGPWASEDVFETDIGYQLEGIFDNFNQIWDHNRELKSMIAPAFSTSIVYTAGQYVTYDGVLYMFTADHPAGAWIGTDATAVPEGVAGEVTDLKSATAVLDTRVTAIEEAEGLMRYGVSGIGQSASALTRIWDSVGMTAQVGTDGNNSNVINDFDHVTPFNRRKCVGQWHLVDGRPQFSVHAYYGDENYAEDGSMGDYVAVECPKAYFYLKDGVLGVSAHHYPGWKVFDIFTHNHNVDETFDFAYLPAYALGMKDGHAVSLPGLTNEQGTYKDLLDKARTYADTEVGAKAILEPAAVAFYEWALQTVEFAQQNIKTVMYGCLSLRSSNDDTVVFTDATHILTNNYYASRVVGEAICVYGGTANHTNPAYQATHTIKSIIRCDETGTESTSGTHQLIEVEDLGKNYFTYEIGTTYNLAARPWLTGACNGVSTPSGSPVSNSNGYYPMKYRWRENTHGNQYHTWCDLFNMRVQDADEQDYLEWYYLPDPAAYEPASSSKPDATDLATSAFEKLDVETPHADYVNGYIKTRQYAEEYPEIWIPGTVTGASNTTYYAVFAYLVASSVVRACRFGGLWSTGLVSLNAYDGPANGYAHYGGDLCYAQ